MLGTVSLLKQRVPVRGGSASTELAGLHISQVAGQVGNGIEPSCAQRRRDGSEVCRSPQPHNPHEEVEVPPSQSPNLQLRLPLVCNGEFTRLPVWQFAREVERSRPVHRVYFVRYIDCVVFRSATELVVPKPSSVCKLFEREVKDLSDFSCVELETSHIEYWKRRFLIQFGFGW
jgi:hypothetical protein